jgi:hypothetical protein
LKDECAYGTVLLCTYMDDVCCIREQEAILKAIKEIQNIYNIKRVVELSKFIGVNVEDTEDRVVLSQQDTVARLENVFWKHVTKI